MIKELYEKICSGEDIRANLIKIKEAMNDSDTRKNFAYLLSGDFSVLTDLLKNEDAKVRKNAATILGKLESEDVLGNLFEAYQKEEKLFVKPDYLKAMYELNYQKYMPQLKARLKELVAEIPETSKESIKHVRAEITALQKMIQKYERPGKHKFCMDSCYPEVILLTSRRYRDMTARQITKGEQTMLAGGVRVKGADLSEIVQIRTWRELLFPIHGKKSAADTPESVAQMLMESDLQKLLQELHEGKPPFYFRLELKSDMDEEKKRAFVKKTVLLLEEKSDRKLLNSTSDYEIEIRLVASKKGGMIPLLKCHSFRDKRFLYRKETTAASLNPVNAALIIKIAEPWLKEGAQILDPCCGVGTLLIERTYLKHADPMYGVDIYGEAISKARINSLAANMPIHYINRDFLEFTHDYLFDEIISDLPASEDGGFYRRFFRKADTMLKKEGIMVLFCRRGAEMLKIMKEQETIAILSENPMDMGEDSILVIAQKKEETL